MRNKYNYADCKTKPVLLLNEFCDKEHVRNSNTTKEDNQSFKHIIYDEGG